VTSAFGLIMIKRWIYTNGLYEPKLNKVGEYVESQKEYYLRIRKILPNFPEEVLIQWFYDHWNDIDNFAWLEFQKLNFEVVKWSVPAILASGIECNEEIKTYKYNFVNGSYSERMKSIATFFQNYGTWPIAPLLLKNVDGNFRYPNGFPCNSPYHPLEGLHRYAIFFAYQNKPFVQKIHKIWLVGG